MSDYLIVHLSEVCDWNVYDCSRPGQPLCACSQQADAERIARALRLLETMEQRKADERVLCPTCEGNGVLKIPGGISQCDTCAGFGMVQP